jgi:trk system potassium uptake protein
MNIIIVGCGELGSRLAENLSKGKDNIVVIDTSRKALKKLGIQFNGQAQQGDGLDPVVLERAGIESGDILFSLTGDEDLNLVIGQAAKKMYGVSKVIIQLHSSFKEGLAAKKGLIAVNRTNLFLEEFKKCI